MNWTLWLLLVAMLALAALMSVTRACLAVAARGKPAAAMRLRNERVRGLDELLAQPQSLDWALALIENAAKIAAACLGALLVIAYQDARFLALCLVVVLGLLALAPIIVSRIADRIAYRFCLAALPILQYAAKLAATPYAGLRKAFDASPRKTSNGTPESNGGRLVAPETDSKQARRRCRQEGPRHAWRSSQSQGARSLRRHDPSHQDGHDRRRRAAGQDHSGCT